MYITLLCKRYLQTRFIALASIISVMLGVATMVVVNSVMTGFSTQMKDRLHALLADVVIETHGMDGVEDPEEQMSMARMVAGDQIVAITPSIEVFGLMSFNYGGLPVTQPVTLIGIDPVGKSKVGPLTDFLDSYNPIIKNGVVARPALREKGEVPNWNLTADAMEYRKTQAELQRWYQQQQNANDQLKSEVPNTEVNTQQQTQASRWDTADFTPTPAPEMAKIKVVNPHNPVPTISSTDTPAAAMNPMAAIVEYNDEKTSTESLTDDTTGDSVPDNLTKTEPGIEEIPLAMPTNVDVASDQKVKDLFFPVPQADSVKEVDLSEPREGRLYVGIGLISFNYPDPETGEQKIHMMTRPGDDIKISTVVAGRRPEPTYFNATIVDVFKSGMSEYDSQLVFCDLKTLQKARGMIVQETGKESITTLQIRLKDYNQAPLVIERLKSVFPASSFQVRTWQQKQGALLAAVEVESAILNVLLFLIIAVAGFGILAIFFMIVVEKTRDIGILMALGASSRGIMTIFLSYGLALGVVGSGMGVVLGLLFVHYINEIERVITFITGRKVFDETIYYFPEIPTMVQPMMVFWVAFGAMTIAVMASVIPARRAASLNPVEALRLDA
jgi:lipoprotein-releasing system permease protein